jgi:hypothetical protein
MKLLGFDLVNEDKIERALHGNIGAEGKLVGGVGDNASDMEKLAEYDKLGGLVRKGKYNLKIGCFFDFTTQKAKESPEVVFTLKDLNGNTVEVPEGEDIPLEVRAAEIQKEKKSAKKVKKSKKDVEDEDEED